MVKQFFIFSLLLILSHSCISIRNEQDMIRVNKSRFTLRSCINNNFVYENIDTTAVYLETSIDSKSYTINAILDTVNVISLGNYLKFYKEGKVAFFQGAKIKNKSDFNPKKATMGFYCFNENSKYMEFIFYHVQSGNFLSKRKIEVKGDTIKEYKIPSSTGGRHYRIYIKQNIPKEFLIYKPDW